MKERKKQKERCGDGILGAISFILLMMLQSFLLDWPSLPQWLLDYKEMKATRASKRQISKKLKIRDDFKYIL